MSPLAHLTSAVSLAVITLNLTFWVIPLVLAGILKWIWPFGVERIDSSLDWIYRAAVAVDDFWLDRVLGISWPRPAIGVARGESCIVVANHVSWSDILLIQSVLARRGPLVKFLTKRELMWIPIFGIIFWAFEFPMLRRTARHTQDEEARRQADRAALESACAVVRRRPAALVNFAEGTRFSPSKRLERGGPFEYLLPPRVGGFHLLLEGMPPEVEQVLIVTLLYPGPASFWTFLSGAMTEVGVEVQAFARSDLPGSREDRRRWLEARWAEMDARISATRTGG